MLLGLDVDARVGVRGAELSMVRLACASVFLLLAGCAAWIGSATGRLAGDVTSAVLDQNDPETVRDGAPAYLLMVDGLIEGASDDRNLLLAGARLYTAYAAAFVDDPGRARRLTERALGYARRALCAESPRVCEAVARPFDEFAPTLRSLAPGDVPVAYGFASAWAGWVQARADDWVAVAEIPRIQALFERVIELDETHDGGAAHVSLGVLHTLRPASLGGQPERGRAHFERAIELSGGRNLMAKVLYAQHYARLVFDRPLHDRLLREVLASEAEAPGLTLGNVLAQEQAVRLLDGADDYF